MIEAPASLSGRPRVAAEWALGAGNRGGGPDLDATLRAASAIAADPSAGRRSQFDPKLPSGRVRF